MCNNNTDCKCISDILKVINILQKKAVHHEEAECEDICDRRTLGFSCRSFCEFNTRPIQLFLCGGNGNDPLVMPTVKGPITPTTTFSNVFRVEKVDDCCCTCRVLIPEPNPNPTTDCWYYTATNSFFTLDLKCVCVVKCLDDAFVDCV